jgi:SAM-dependent methyltransferase
MRRDDHFEQTPCAVAPRYLLRVLRVLEILEKLKPISVLEIGCGTGDLLDRLAQRQYRAHGVEISEDAFILLKRRFAGRSNPTFAVGDFRCLTGRYDALLAFEVLEHVEDDDVFVSKCRDLLRPGGYLLLSVPAHKWRWSSHDEAVGHFRRYERAELTALLARHELVPLRIDCYGFPISNIVAPLRRIASRGLLSLASREERTKQSGIPPTWMRRFRWLCNPVTIWPWVQFQKLFLRTELGDGYLVVARRRDAIVDG